MNLTISAEDRRDKQVEAIRRLLSAGKQLFIWGKGEFSRLIVEYLREKGVTHKPKYLIDDAFMKGEEPDTVSLSQFMQSGSFEDVIVFGFYNYGVIQQKRAELGHLLPNLFEFHFAVVQGRRLKWDPVLAKARLEEYRQTYSLLEDERSRKTMQCYLNAATAGEFDTLYRECRIQQDYFNEITLDLKPDTLIDCGAFDGDSIHEFIQAFPNYQRLIAFEPDPNNAELIRKREKNERMHGLMLIEKGVYSENMVLYFQANGESNSFLSGSGDTMVEVTKLDDYRSEIIGAAFLKMDIEGSELEALKGAKNLIREEHPILAICVYHKESDLIDIPQYIHATAGVGAYHYYLGFHGQSLAELCFYAIPTGMEAASQR